MKENIIKINTLPKYSWVHDRYVVSDKGYVMNTETGKVLSLFNQGMSRGQIWLYGKGRKMKVYRHRIVAEAFVPNPSCKPDVNHLDENPTNDKAINLQWCTKAENNRYGTKAKRMLENAGKNIIGIMGNGNAVLFTRKQAESMYGKLNPILRCCNAKDIKLKKYKGVFWSYLEPQEKQLELNIC